MITSEVVYHAGVATMCAVDFYVSIQTLDSVQKFVEAASRVEGTVCLVGDKFSLNGKCILDIYALDLRQNIHVYVETPNSQCIDAFVAALAE